MDYYLVACDYSQIELRFLAIESGSKGLLECYTPTVENPTGLDVHMQTAMARYGLPSSEISKQMRTMAKPTNFGIPYGLSPIGQMRQAHKESPTPKELRGK